MTTGEKKPPSGSGKAAGDGLAVTSSQPNITTTSIQHQARLAIQALLDTDDPAPVDLASLGAWAEHYQTIAKGTDRAQRRQVFDALARADRALAVLIASNPAPRKTWWTPAELLAAKFPDPVWAVPGILPVGLSFLAGRPKLGKSWLGLQVAHAVGTGGQVFGVPVKQGKVLFLALEDSPRRIADRMRKQHIPGNAGITFVTEWRAFVDGGLADLQDEVGREGYTFVIVDTFSRALGRADQQDLTDMTAILGNLQQMAMLYDVAVLLIDHHRKSNGFDASPIDDILGSTAKAAVADAALGLYREAGKAAATLRVTGRDIEEQELALTWDGMTCSWQYLGSAGDVRKDSVKGEVLLTIETLLAQGQTATNASITAYLGKDKALISRTLAELLNSGDVVRLTKRGRVQPYGLPGINTVNNNNIVNNNNNVNIVNNDRLWEES